jgi:hypothetical protein
MPERERRPVRILNRRGNTMADNYRRFGDFQRELTAGSNECSISVFNPDIEWNQQGRLIPVPPAVWLFGSGLVGLIGGSTQTQAGRIEPFPACHSNARSAFQQATFVACCRFHPHHH